MDGVISCYKLFLACHSEFLHHLLSAQQDLEDIILPDISVSAVRSLLSSIFIQAGENVGLLVTVLNFTLSPLCSLNIQQSESLPTC